MNPDQRGPGAGERLWRAWTPAEDAVLKPLLGVGKLPYGERRRLAEELRRGESAISSRLGELRRAAGFIGSNRSQAGRSSHVGPEHEGEAGRSGFAERYGGRAGAEPGVVERRCLGCGGAFMAPGRFIRVCVACKTADSWRWGP